MRGCDESLEQGFSSNANHMADYFQRENCSETKDDLLDAGTEK